MIDDGRDPDDEHYDAPAYHYPGSRMRILLANPANYSDKPNNEAFLSMWLYARSMRDCCVECLRELLDDDGA